MSDFNTCERNVDLDRFIAAIAAESAEAGIYVDPSTIAVESLCPLIGQKINTLEVPIVQPVVISEAYYV